MRFSWPFKPHYVREYRNMVRTLQRIEPETAMERAVGGDYIRIGTIQAEQLRELGLSQGHYLIDVGCGSGRTAFALRDDESLRYHGTDVVSELLAYARAKVNRPDWRFTLVEGLVIPEVDAVADMIVMFSLITHLTAREASHSIADAARVLKPVGKLLVSFLDKTIGFHRNAAGGMLFQLRGRLAQLSVKNVVTDREKIAAWARDLRLGIAFFGPERFG